MWAVLASCLVQVPWAGRGVWWRCHCRWRACGDAWHSFRSTWALETGQKLLKVNCPFSHFYIEFLSTCWITVALFYHPFLWNGILINQLSCLITIEKPLNETNLHIHSEKHSLYIAVIPVLEKLKQGCEIEESLGLLDKYSLKKGKRKSVKGLLYVTSSICDICICPMDYRNWGSAKNIFHLCQSVYFSYPTPMGKVPLRIPSGKISTSIFSFLISL